MRNYFKKALLLIVLVVTSNLANAQIVNIPDANFKAALIDDTYGIDTNNDNEIQFCEAIAVTELYISELNISDLTGVEAFSNLKYLNCSFNNLSRINIDSFISLNWFSCSHNNIDSIDFSSNDSLETADCSNNKINQIKLNQSIRDLNCSNNLLDSLNLEKCDSLITLDCTKNKISEINLCKSIAKLNCSNNLLTSLELERCVSLTQLYCSNNNISLLDFQSNSKLIIISCASNNLTSIKSDSLINLHQLTCSNSSLDSLDLSNSEKLTYLNCGNNRLSYLDIKGKQHLETLYCDSNKITKLNTGNNLSLRYLDCSDNKISELDISSSIWLKRLYCQNNILSSLTITNNTFLTMLDCSNNNINNLDVSGCLYLWISKFNFNNMTSICVNPDQKIKAYEYPLEWVKDSSCVWNTTSCYYNRPQCSLSTSREYDEELNQYLVDLTISFEYTEPIYTLEYLWEFGDGDTSTLASPIHKYNVSLFHNVDITVYMPNGESCSTFVYLPVTYGVDINNGYTLKTQNNIATSIEDKENEGAGVSIFPNPNNGIFTVNFNHIYSDKSIQLYKITGERILSDKHFGGSNYTIDISSENDGIYVIEVIENGNISRNKIIKQGS